MIDAGRELGLEVLVEVRDEAELDRALDAGATIIGVNNRNLETLVIDPATSERLLPLHSARRSSRSPRAACRRAPTSSASRACGADAVLVGSSISAAADPAAASALRLPACRGSPVAADVKFCGLTRADGRGVRRRGSARSTWASSSPAVRAMLTPSRRATCCATCRRASDASASSRDQTRRRDRAHRRRWSGSTSFSCTATPMPDRVGDVRARDRAPRSGPVVRIAGGDAARRTIEALCDVGRRACCSTRSSPGTLGGTGVDARRGTALAASRSTHARRHARSCSRAGSRRRTSPRRSPRSRPTSSTCRPGSSRARDQGSRCACARSSPRCGYIERMTR